MNTILGSVHWTLLCFFLVCLYIRFSNINGLSSKQCICLGSMTCYEDILMLFDTKDCVYSQMIKISIFWELLKFFLSFGRSQIRDKVNWIVIINDGVIKLYSINYLKGCTVKWFRCLCCGFLNFIFLTESIK